MCTVFICVVSDTYCQRLIDFTITAIQCFFSTTSDIKSTDNWAPNDFAAKNAIFRSSKILDFWHSIEGHVLQDFQVIFTLYGSRFVVKSAESLQLTSLSEINKA